MQQVKRTSFDPSNVKTVTPHPTIQAMKQGPLALTEHLHRNSGDPLPPPKPQSVPVTRKRK